MGLFATKALERGSQETVAGGGPVLMEAALAVEAAPEPMPEMVPAPDLVPEVVTA